MKHRLELPVAVIGAGPVGLSAAAWLHERELPVEILEAGDEAGSNIREWGHVRLFSPWRYNTDQAAARLLAAHGWEPPDGSDHPTGNEFVDRYLAPLAALPELKASLRLGARVAAVTRDGVDKLGEDRRDRPFVLTVHRDGSEERLLARAVIDASGTWRSPNPLGADGVPAAGERAAAGQVSYGIPDVLGEACLRYAGRTTAVVGSGHSAQNAVRDLAELARTTPGSRVVWVVRRGDAQSLFGDGKDDQLPARGRLSADARALVESGEVELITGFRINGVSRDGRRLRLHASDRSAEGIDEVVAATGFRPDFSPLRELRLAVDPVVESTLGLAPLIDPHLHSCGTVPTHGAAELAHPEPDFYVVGAKSYGRAPTFLAKTGYEQVRSVITAIAGDGEASPAVRVDLLDTGVRANDETSVVEDSVGRVVTAGDCGPVACDGPGVIPAVDGSCHRAVISEVPGCCG